MYVGPSCVFICGVCHLFILMIVAVTLTAASRLTGSAAEFIVATNIIANLLAFPEMTLNRRVLSNITGVGSRYNDRRLLISTSNGHVWILPTQAWRAHLAGMAVCSARAKRAASQA